MSRSRELMTLASIAEETGISYATLRNYAIKYIDEIPSEGSGRSTRYPRAAVKVFQRLRRESKPGRKPASASAPTPLAVSIPAPAVQAAAPVPVVRQEAPLQYVPRQAATDTSGIEKQLAAIQGFLERIANSLEQVANEPRAAAPSPVIPPSPSAEEERAEAPSPVAPERERAAVPLPPIEMRDAPERTGHRRLHSLPKVMGQRGKRPD